MLRLILMRHAKSDWGDPGLSDHDRPLNPRGQRDAPRMARWLADAGWVPDLVLASTATRVRETIQGMEAVWESVPPVLYSDALYLASPEELLRTIRSDAISGDTLLVVAHNPGLQILVSQLAGELVSFPTAAMALFHVNATHWSDVISAKQACLVHLIRPKEIED